MLVKGSFCLFFEQFFLCFCASYLCHLHVMKFSSAISIVLFFNFLLT
ncbi:hypothetical protein CSC17_0138 [Klebsiella oxytoca]|nr:hypothetical protein CSC17_0138 [Klebsiella oxytoca]